MSEQPISPDPSAPPEIGNRLAQAREAAALTVDQVAAKLLVSASQIRAIESGRMASSYSAGYYERTVRKYADFLDIEFDQTALPAAAAAVGQAHAVNQDASPAARLAGFTPQRVGISGRIDRPTIESSWNAKSWIVGAIVLILVAAGFLLRDKLLDPSPSASGSGSEAASVAPPAPSPVAPSASATPTTPPSAASLPAAPASAVATNAPASQPSRSGGVSSSSDSSTSPVEGERPAAPAPEVSALSPGAASSALATLSSTPTPPDSDGRITVTFDAPCWVQLIKSDGTRTEKIFPPDQVLEFPVDALASLVIGNARSARMAIDGRDINLSQFMKGDVVRMSDAALHEALR